jgi:ElaB/YqjD/DUF883 family membrane-anchored ribosome-binding protein
MNSNTKSSKQLKREVENQLNAIDKDIDQLKNRLTPGRLIDDAVFSRYRGNPRATFDYLKSNPVGTTFLALGTILLMEDESHQSYETLAKRRTSDALDQAHTQAGELMTDARLRVDDLKENIRSKMPHKDQTQAQGPSKMDMAKSKLNSAKENLVSKARESVDSAKSTFESTKESISNQTQKTSESFNSASERLRASSSSSKMEGEDLKSKAQEGLQKAHSNIDSAKEGIRSRAQEGLESVRSRVNTDAIKQSTNGMQPMAFMALGAGLGALTGASLSGDDNEFGDLEEKISEFNHDLQEALNESANVLKNQFMSDFKDLNVNIF